VNNLTGFIRYAGFQMPIEFGMSKGEVVSRSNIEQKRQPQPKHTYITPPQSLSHLNRNRLSAKMATDSTPLLYPAPSDATTESQSTISTHSLAQKHWFRRLTSRRNVVPFFLTLVGTLTIILAVTLLTSMDRPKPKNLILMVSDGMGPASLSLARSYMQYVEDVEFYQQLPLDPYIVGTSRTRSHGRLPSVVILFVATFYLLT